VGSSRRYLCNLCVGARTHTPWRPAGAFTRFFPADIGLTPVETSSSRQILHAAVSAWSRISWLQSFTDVRAPTLARPPGCSHREVSVDFGRPGLIHHAELGSLPAPSSGIATCLIRATDMVGLSPTRLQPCRLLLPPSGSSADTARRTVTKSGP
jgi:hypothetical protein